MLRGGWGLVVCYYVPCRFGSDFTPPDWCACLDNLRCSDKTGGPRQWMTILISGDQSIGEEVVRNPRSEHPVKEFPRQEVEETGLYPLRDVWSFRGLGIAMTRASPHSLGRQPFLNIMLKKASSVAWFASPSWSRSLYLMRSTPG